MAITRIGNPAIADVRGVNFRNIIINGDMSIAQRATSASSITSTSYNTIDRFVTFMSGLGTWTQSQSTDVPTGQGFVSSLKMDCTTADASPASSDYLKIRQRIEGQNLQYLKKGTSSAESLTCSFFVKSNKTGTYICELFDGDNSRAISRTYTISSADTWEKKTVTFPGDTTGALGNDNGDSLRLSFWLGAGSDFTSGTLQSSWTGPSVNANRAVGQVNLADSTSNEWYVTGIQLEAGSQASDFEFLPTDVNYNRCKRYYQQVGDTPDGRDESKQGITGQMWTNAQLLPTYALSPSMRTAPSMSTSTSSLGTVYTNGVGLTINSVAANSSSRTHLQPALSTSSAATKGYAGHVDATGGYLLIDSEL